MAKVRRRRKLSGAAKSAFLARMAKGRRKHRTVKANPVARRRRRHSARRSGSHVIRVRRNPISLRRIRRRIGAAGRGVTLSQAGIKRVAVPAAMAGVGALGLDVLMGYANQYLPEQLKSGTMNSVVKLVGAIGLGAIVSKYGSKAMGEAVAVGGITVVVHDIARRFVQDNAPSVPLSGMQADSIGLIDMQALSAYGLGYYNPAPLSTEARGLGLHTESLHGFGG